MKDRKTTSDTVRLSTVGPDKLRQSCRNPGILPISQVSLTLSNFIRCRFWADLLVTRSRCQKPLGVKIPAELSTFTRGQTIIDLPIWATESCGEITWGKIRVWARPPGNNSNGNRLNGLIRTNGGRRGRGGSGWLHSPPELSSRQYRHYIYNCTVSFGSVGFHVVTLKGSDSWAFLWCVSHLCLCQGFVIVARNAPSLFMSMPPGAF